MAGAKTEQAAARAKEAARRAPAAPVVPPSADLLVMFATTDDHVAFGSRASGSVLVAALCDLLADPRGEAHTKGLAQLAMAANARVEARLGGQQVAEVSHRLTRDVFLRPAVQQGRAS